jgi:formylaminopyrimidine deformylase / aminopyrimidine aminohydrolase
VTQPGTTAAARQARAFSERLVGANQGLWAAMAAHPFVRGLADGTLPAAALAAWLQQDRCFVLEERRAVAALRAHGLPDALERLLGGLDGALVAEAGKFADQAASLGLPAEVEPWPLCLGYTSFLLASARDGLLDGLVVLYAAERAYLDTWTSVRAGEAGEAGVAGSPWRGWIENWTSTEFRGFVADLGAQLDALAGTPPAPLAARLATAFTRAAAFELAFWEMCWRRADWPG